MRPRPSHLVPTYAGSVSSVIGSLLVRSGLSACYGRMSRNSNCVVLSYHRVCPEDRVLSYDGGFAVPPSRFSEQMGCLRSSYTPVSLSELIRGLRGDDALPPKAVHVTFDDGYADLHEHAFPVLRQYGIPSTVFLPVDYVGSSRMFWWDELGAALAFGEQVVVLDLGCGASRLDLRDERKRARTFRALRNTLWRESAISPEEAVGKVRQAVGWQPPDDFSSTLSWDQVVQMSSENVDFGSHTCSHRRLSSLPDDDLISELEDSKHRMEQVLGKEVPAIAYPYGRECDYDSRTLQAAQRAGYKLGFTAVQGVAKPTRDPLDVCRVLIRGSDTMDLFESKVNGVYPAIYSGCRRVLRRTRAG